MSFKKFNSTIYILAASLTFLMISSDVAAQCAMCKLSVETGMKEKTNPGIFLMFAAPYVVVFTVAMVWWFNRKKS